MQPSHLLILPLAPLIRNSLTQHLPVLVELLVALFAQENGSIWKPPTKLGAEGDYQLGRLPVPRRDNALPKQASLKWNWGLPKAENFTS